MGEDFLGVFQYGLLHFGQTVGSRSELGIHSWLQRSQRYPITVMGTRAIFSSTYAQVYPYERCTSKVIYYESEKGKGFTIGER
jgi:hypothetical protein